ncbi:MAG: hypothetical protein AAF266_00815 [Planctomycetota bacterium]
MSISRTVLVALLALGLTRSGLAYDVGEPSFRTRPNDSFFRFEVFHEWFDRDVDLHVDPPLLGTPAAGPLLIGNQIPPVATTQEADQVFVRWVLQPLPALSAQFDLGSDGESTAGDSVITLGGAARILLTENGPFQLSTQFSAHFVPKFDTYEAGVDPILGAYEDRGEFKAYEYGAALVGSMTTPLTENSEIMTYLAPRLSAYRGDYESIADLTDTGERLWLSARAEQSSPFGIAVGSRIWWGRHLSARVEGRFAGETSLSAGIGASF